MKKFLLSVSIALSSLQLSIGQNILPGQIPANMLPERHAHYEHEFTYDKCANEAAWKNLGGLHSAFGSTNKLYFRSEVPQVALGSTYSTTVWRGERVNAQILVWSADSLEQIRASIQDLKDSKGNIISKENITLDMVRYVIADYPYGEKSTSCGPSPYKDGFLMPDRFETLDRFDLPGNTTRPIWATINIPRSTVPGVYTSHVEVRAKGIEPISLTLNVTVQNQILPFPKDWKYRLDLWQNPWAVAWYNNVEPWSEEHMMLLRQHLKPYAEAGGTYITTYAVHSPWSGNSYMIEGGMIEWIKGKDNSWKFDYAIFDKYVELAMECGITKAITLYTAIPWGFRHRYMDETTGDYSYAIWPPTSKEFKEAWNAFLTDFRFHLESKGWLDITYIGINENPMEETLAAANIVKEHSKDWKITYAGNWHEELDTLLDDISFLYGNEPSMTQQKARKDRGATSTFYVCCNPPVPNNFLFSPPIEGRWISWYAMAYGYDGFLRWAYEAWPEDVLRDARHISWAAGDCYMIYPGGKSCIRFEKLREGIVDYEKISIIKEKAETSDNPKVKSLLKALNEHLEVFVKEKNFDEEKIANDIAKGNQYIKELSDLLAQ